MSEFDLPRSGGLRDDDQMTEVVSYPRDPATGGMSDAREQAEGVASHAADAARDVADEAKNRAGDVAQEARERAASLMEQARAEATDEASAQQERLAAGLRNLGVELGRMGSASPDGGYASELVRQASRAAGRLAGWFEAREPGDVVREVEQFARRRPGVFLAAAAGAGVLAGRVLRGATDGSAGRADDHRVAGTAAPRGAEGGGGHVL